MADEYVYGSQPVPGEGERVGFCQDCGRPLTAATVRTVGSGVFCEPCLERRVAGTGFAGAGAAGQGAGPLGAGATGTGTGPGVPPTAGPVESNPFGPGYPPPDGVFPPIDGSTPHPVLAALLGLLPGVGAMYNGQFAKGFVHLIIFAVLVSLADNVNGVFGLLVAGWICFQCFEAYHTAKARREGLPLPDPFGLNNIGERLGVKNWPGSASRPPMPPGTPWTSGQRQGDWVGYVPPSHYATTPPAGTPAGAPPVAPAAEMPVPPPPAAPYGSAEYANDLAESIKAQAYRDAGVPYAPYAAPYTSVPPVAGVDAGAAPVPARRFPVGAMWLIGLGVLFLLGNIDPALRYSWRWLLPVFLAGAAIWLFVRRLTAVNRSGRGFAGVACGLRAPVVLMTLAVLFALQTAHWLTLGQTWPVLLVAFGAVLVLERTAGRSSYVAPQPTAPGTFGEQGYAATSVAGPVPPAWTPTSDAVKGGQ